MGGGKKTKKKAEGVSREGSSRATSSGESDDERRSARSRTREIELPPGITERVRRGGSAASGCSDGVNEVEMSELNADVSVGTSARRGSMGVNVRGAGKKRKSDAFMDEVVIEVNRMDESREIERMKDLTNELSEYLLNDSNRVSKIACDFILKKASMYERMLMNVLCENASLRGRLKEVSREKERLLNGPCRPAVPVSSERPGANVGMPTAARPSFALVVKGSMNETNESVMERLKKTSVSPDVRVKSVRMAKSGGVVLETVSAIERERLRKSECFGKVGLSVNEPKQMLPRVIVYDVSNAMTDDVFMNELYSKNVKSVCSEKVWKESARIAVRQSREGAPLGNVVLEVPHKVRDALVNERRVYVGWGAHRVNVYEKVSRCYGCFQFGHLKHECKSECLCRRCGRAGHKEAACKASPNCVNCSVRKREAGHSAMSEECPEYVWRLERLRARVNNSQQWR